MDVLQPLAAGLVRCVHIYGRYQLPQGVAVQLVNADVLVRRLNELFNVFVLSFLYFNLPLQGNGLSFRLLLLRFVGLAQHIIALIAQPSAGVVLVNFDEQPFQLANSSLIVLQLLPADANLFRAFQSQLLLHDRPKMGLVPRNVVRNCLYVLQDHAFQNLDTNEVRLAFFSVLPVFRAVEEYLHRISVVGGVVHHLCPAVRAVDKSREDAASAGAGHSMPLLADHLNLFKHIILNDVLMSVREDCLLLNGIVPLLLVPDEVRISLEIHRAACVFPPFQNPDNCAALPTARVI